MTVLSSGPVNVKNSVTVRLTTNVVLTRLVSRNTWFDSTGISLGRCVVSLRNPEFTTLTLT